MGEEHLAEQGTLIIQSKEDIYKFYEHEAILKHALHVVATKQEMAEARLPIAYRDQCASLLIPLNQCRRKTLYMPFKCEELRHAYEKCQYVEYVLKVYVIQSCLKVKSWSCYAQVQEACFRIEEQMKTYDIDYKIYFLI